MKNNKDVVLTSNAQWSLIFFLGSFVVGALVVWLIGFLLKEHGIPSLFVMIPPVVIIIFYITSLILGLFSLKASKFPLLWIIPCSLMIIPLGYTTVTDLSRMIGSGINTVEKSNVIQPGKGLGVSIGQEGESKTQIVAVFYQSPAEKFGLKNGDIIFSIQNTRVHDRNDIVNTLNNLNESFVKVEVLRNGSRTTVTVDR